LTLTRKRAQNSLDVVDIATGQCAGISILKEINRMTNFMLMCKRTTASVLVFSVACLGLPMGAQATGMVPTDEIQSEQTVAASQADRDKVNQFFARDDVRQGLVQQGVAPEAALERVAAMTDTEVAQLAGRIDQAPAGGDVLGVLFTVFIVLLVTDILGLTKIFPFTRSVR
jgi:hypothetical protein